MTTAAKMVLHDWQRGKIPFFVTPPERELPLDEPGIKNIENDTAVDSNQKSTYKAIADIISSQQLSSIPVQKDLFTEEELKGDEA